MRLWILVGTGQSSMAFTFEGSLAIPSGDMTRNHTSLASHVSWPFEVHGVVLVLDYLSISECHQNVDIGTTLHNFAHMCAYNCGISISHLLITILSSSDLHNKDLHSFGNPLALQYPSCNMIKKLSFKPINHTINGAYKSYVHVDGQRTGSPPSILLIFQSMALGGEKVFCYRSSDEYNRVLQ